MYNVYNFLSELSDIIIPHVYIEEYDEEQSNLQLPEELINIIALNAEIKDVVHLCSLNKSMRNECGKESF